VGYSPPSCISVGSWVWSSSSGDDGAVGNRKAGYVTGFAASWLPGDPRAGDHRAWARQSWEGIRLFSTGGNYVNFQVADDDPTRTSAAYGANFDRLRKVIAAWDPDNLPGEPQRGPGRLRPSTGQASNSPSPPLAPAGGRGRYGLAG
jgi:hypothetical protein